MAILSELVAAIMDAHLPPPAITVWLSCSWFSSKIELCLSFFCLRPDQGLVGQARGWAATVHVRGKIQRWWCSQDERQNLARSYLDRLRLDKIPHEPVFLYDTETTLRTFGSRARLEARLRTY
jgi:hypothetical protein